MSVPRIVFLCDAGPRRGIGHVMRGIALAEEFAARGAEPVFVADVTGVPWAAAQVTTRGFGLHAHATDRPGLLAAVLALRPDALVIDSYVAAPDVSARIRAAGIPVLAIVDGDARGQCADLYLDQNLGAEAERSGGAGRLAGLPYVLLRTAVRSARPARPRTDVAVAVPQVFAYFGGTDPVGAAPILAQCLAATRLAVEASFVAATPTIAAAIEAVPLGVDQHITVSGPVDDLPERAARADLVLCASGTSVWEMMCVGAATALTWVADNQADGYTRTVATGAVAGLGHIDALRASRGAAVAGIAALLRDPAARATMRATAWALVDGDGRRRVADAMSTYVTLRSDPR
jgi:spore coat polysaccharide biosynthesis predicted glycosyltransferase SpsG